MRRDIFSLIFVSSVTPNASFNKTAVRLHLISLLFSLRLVTCFPMCPVLFFFTVLYFFVTPPIWTSVTPVSTFIVVIALLCVLFLSYTIKNHIHSIFFLFLVFQCFGFVHYPNTSLHFFALFLEIFVSILLFIVFSIPRTSSTLPCRTKNTKG